jgi:hypothetical protein
VILLHRYTNRSIALQEQRALTIVGVAFPGRQKSHSAIEFTGFSQFDRIIGAT